MKSIEIKRTQNDGSQITVVVCRLVEGRVLCEGDEELVHSLSTEGIRDYSEVGEVSIFPNEGERFLEQLPYNFRSGYITAVPIEEQLH